MGVITIKKGLQLPISGDPDQVLEEGRPVTKVAIIGDDYVGMKPTMEVQVGDEVRLGQVLFFDKKIPGVKYTSPGTGRVVEINRGARRHFESIVIELAGDGEVEFASYAAEKLAALERETVQVQLIDSGLWPSFRSRPFSRAPAPGSVPHSIFITAMDTNPLAPDMETVLAGHEEAFKNGLTVLTRLTEGPLYLCKAEGSAISAGGMKQVVEQEFAGPHPAGNVGTHIHFLDPVGESKTVWHIGFQDVVAIGKLFTTGKLAVERIIAIGGPSLKKPRLIKTRMGACLDELLKDELTAGENRVVSGSVLSGRKAAASYAYLGKFHQQVSVLPEGTGSDAAWLVCPPAESAFGKEYSYFTIEPRA